MKTNVRRIIPRDMMGSATRTASSSPLSMPFCLGDLSDRMRQDRRRDRAMQFTAMVLQIVSRHVDNRAMQIISDELFALCYREGAEIITDHMRADMGLPARGPDGWTVEEYVAMEQRRLEAMMAPLPCVIPIPIKEDGK